ncbi:Lrp/AsnC family transcriptional regulator [Candidatus Pacearchaeota archaeon]|nr:Lrp/AsnC family transcriptional regulator [Candidatus Pacearchaeota archaeon]
MRYLQQTKETKKVKTDAKDRKILALLSQNARIPLTKLAKQVALSRDAVNYRIKNYEKDGLIQGYRTMVDISKFGYNNYHLFLKLNNPSQEIEQKIIKKLEKYPNIRAIIKFSGNFDFEIALIAKNIEELDSLITKIISDCFGYMHDYEILTITKTYAAETFPPNFSDFKIERKIEKRETNIDKKDIEILKIIGENAQLPLYEIGGKVKLSADAVAYRIKNMINSSTIIKFIPVINYTSLDYNLYTILLNISALDKKKEKILKDFLTSDKNTLWAVKTIGRFNVLIYLLVKDINELQETLLKLRALFPKEINHYENLIAYEEYKYVYFPKNLF